MKYTEITLSAPFTQEYEWDMFYQGLADLGFESFMDDKAYIQTALFNEEPLRQFAEESGVSILAITDCPDQNWNETWEAEHEMEELPLGIRIIPHCAFGAGHHETTSMMIDAIIALAQKQPLGDVLDQGCGTGVLGIFAKHLGANHVTAVDIDDKSVANTLENAALNHLDIEAILGSDVPEGSYHLILANIHRNILLDMMPRFAQCLLPGACLFLSGFYEDDVPALLEETNKYGIKLTEMHKKGDWCMLEMTK